MKESKKAAGEPQQPADSKGGPPTSDVPSGKGAAQEPAQGFTEQEIRDKGWQVEVPFEVPDPEPEPLTYSAGSAEQWYPEPGLEMGGIPWADLPPLLSQGQGDQTQGEQGTDASAGDGADQQQGTDEPGAAS